MEKSHIYIISVTIGLFLLWILFSESTAPRPEKQTKVIYQKQEAPKQDPSETVKPKKPKYSASGSSGSYTAQEDTQKDFDPILDMVVKHNMKRELAVMTVDFQMSQDLLLAKEALDAKNYSKAEILYRKIIKENQGNLLILLSAYGGLWQIGRESGHPESEEFKRNYYGILDQYTEYVKSNSADIPDREDKTYQGLQQFKNKMAGYQQSLNQTPAGFFEKNAAEIKQKTGGDVNFHQINQAAKIWNEGKDKF